MLNNYFHDLAVAVLFCSLLTSWLIWRGLQKSDLGSAVGFLKTRVWRGLTMAVRVSLIWIIAGGFVRAFAYMDYEWIPAAGRDQIPALIVKHVLLVALVALGVYFYLKLRRSVNEANDSKSNTGNASIRRYEEEIS
jgi:hypothetical protein